MKIRFVNADDSNAIRNIYAQYIDTPITFECSLPTEEEFAKRVESISKDYPYLVCEDDGRIVGYAYAHRQLEREAYQWNAELSVYIDKEYTSKGLGTQLCNAVMDILKRQGVRNVYSLVTVPNSKSENLHRVLGFKRAVTYQKTGYKNGRWHDVAWFEKNILPCEEEPKPFQSIREIRETIADFIFVPKPALKGSPQK